MPAVSVIMPALNAGATIGPAIESVLRQTMADLELLVVDDGSSDDTPAVVTRFAQADPRVRLLAQANAGPGPARNAGFRAGAGRFYAFLDSDDEWAPRFLEAQLSILAAWPEVDVVCGNAWNRGGARDGQPARPVGVGPEEIPLVEMLGNEQAFFIMSVFRRTVIDAVGGFDPAMFTNEEYEMWIRAALSGFRFVRNPEPLGWYACRSGSLSSSDARMVEGILRVYAKTRPLLAPASMERAILDRQVARFEIELMAIHARTSLARGDRAAAARHLAALHGRRGGILLRLAAWLPGLAVAVYRLREHLRNQHARPMARAGTGVGRVERSAA